MRLGHISEAVEQLANLEQDVISYRRFLRIGLLGWCSLHGGRSAFGQASGTDKNASPIQDNSFLIEEAYNQEHGVVQHISTFSRMWNSKDWSYTFTQEWPGLRNWRHQFSYTLSGMHAGGFSGSGAGIGDTILNYRYQVLGDGETKLAFAPRISLLLPTGSAQDGRGAGALGIQTNLPWSIVLHRRLVSHTNLGSTFIPHAQNAVHARATSVGYSFGQSFIYLLHPRVNFLVETCANSFQSVITPGETTWTRTQYVSPGVRWASNFKSGLQIVPGIGVPIGVGTSAGERGIFLYLSFEHPFSKP